MRRALVILVFTAQISLASQEAKFDRFLLQEAHRTGISVSQVFRLWNVESGKLLDAAVGKAGEVGRAQIKLSTALDYDRLATTRKLHEKWYNAKIMFMHLRSIRKQLREAGAREDILPALMFSAYNRGVAKVIIKMDAGQRATNSYGRYVAWGTKR